jgi:hypothetical protein
VIQVRQLQRTHHGEIGLNGSVESDWIGALRAGDFKRAWTISDRNLREYCESGEPMHTGERHQQRIWRGETLAAKRVLVRCYHGLGDTIQFVRFIKPLRQIARQVILWCQPELLSLMQRVDGIDLAIPLHDGVPDVRYDVDIEVMELAHALRVTAEQISQRVPYLSVGNTRALPPQRSASVGLVWEAGGWDPRRSVPPGMLVGLSSIPGLQLYSLQQGPGRQVAAAIAAEDIAVTDLELLAEAILDLDLVITVDTMVAHLAGALGAPVWTMLHADCDWRWPLIGGETVWYPTMRLYHQTTAGDWTAVIRQIELDLGEFCRSRARRDAAVGSRG